LQPVDQVQDSPKHIDPKPGQIGKGGVFVVSGQRKRITSVERDRHTRPRDRLLIVLPVLGRGGGLDNGLLVSVWLAGTRHWAGNNLIFALETLVVGGR
jgi:hypothetical protein